MRVAAITERKLGLPVFALMFAAVPALVVVIPAFGTRPYGEQAILQQIDHEDSALCQKFGFAATTSQFADCMLALADIRHRHVDLLAAYAWL